MELIFFLQKWTGEAREKGEEDMWKIEEIEIDNHREEGETDNILAYRHRER